MKGRRPVAGASRLHNKKLNLNPDLTTESSEVDVSNDNRNNLSHHMRRQSLEDLKFEREKFLKGLKSRQVSALQVSSS